MRIIKPSVEFYGAVPTDYAGALRFIEKCGRTCYKSEDKITEDSADPFVRRLIKSGHLAMVEHSNFVVRAVQEVDVSAQEFECLDVGKYLSKDEDTKYYYVGGNITAWMNKATLDMNYSTVFYPFLQTYKSVSDYVLALYDHRDKKILHWEPCPHNEIPPELHRYSAKFICDRGVSHELVRHRPCSFAQESTRYVNYAGKEMEFIEPDGFEWWDIGVQYQLKWAFEECEFRYQQSIREGLKPQQARTVLPNALKTEIVVTADAAEWRHIRKLRTAKDVHPDMRRVMNMMPWEEFV